jgi:hypothetical protein
MPNAMRATNLRVGAQERESIEYLEVIGAIPFDDNIAMLRVKQSCVAMGN